MSELKCSTLAVTSLHISAVTAWETQFPFHSFHFDSQNVRGILVSLKKTTTNKAQCTEI